LTASSVLASIVGAVLLFAGVQKLTNTSLFLQGAAALGVPKAAARVVPPLETLLGATLILGVLQVAVRIGALSLLVAFTALIVVNLIRGNRPACACFGSRARTPISWWTVTRNCVLIGVIVVALLVA